MDAAHAAEWGGQRRRHHHHHHGPRGLEGFIALMQGRGGPGGGFDPRFFKEFAFGPGGRGGPWGGHRRGGRARRGDVRAALLLLLAEEARNGYQLIQEIERRTEGFWKPSPGSVYPSLQQLEDEGLVRTTSEGRKAYELTDEGRAHVEENAEKLGTPWDAVKGDMAQGAWELMGAMRQIGGALFQLTHSGSEAQQQQAKEVLAETRRKLYRILADEPSEDR
jgi:DNA-binding PadR family transcriptional regulator